MFISSSFTRGLSLSLSCALYSCIFSILLYLFLHQATAAAIVDVLSPFAAEYRATTAALAASASMSLLAPASAVAVSTSGSAGSAAAIGGDLSSAELFFSGATTAASAAAVGASSIGSGAAVAAAGPGVAVLMRLHLL